MKNYEELALKLLKALNDAYKHLEYCGYGDSWEREVAEGLPTELSNVLEEGAKELGVKL